MSDIDILERARHVLRENSHREDVIKKRFREGEITKEDWIKRLSLIRAENVGIRRVFAGYSADPGSFRIY